MIHFEAVIFLFSMNFVSLKFLFLFYLLFVSIILNNTTVTI